MRRQRVEVAELGSPQEGSVVRERGPQQRTWRVLWLIAEHGLPRHSADRSAAGGEPSNSAPGTRRPHSRWFAGAPAGPPRVRASLALRVVLVRPAGTDRGEPA